MGTSCDLRVESLADHPELLAGRLGSWAWSSARKTGGGEWAVSCWTACRMPPRHLATLGPGLRPATKRLGSISAAAGRPSSTYGWSQRGSPRPSRPRRPPGNVGARSSPGESKMLTEPCRSGFMKFGRGIVTQ